MDAGAAFDFDDELPITTAGGGFELDAGAAFDFDDELPITNCQRTSRTTASAEARAVEVLLESTRAASLLKWRID